MRFNTTDFNPSDEETTPQKPLDLAPLNFALDEFSTKKEEFNKLKQSLINDFRVFLETLAQDIFINIPQLKAISWLQYTPFFNDGDECTFRIRDIIYYNFIPENGFFRYAEEIHEEEYPADYWACSDYDLHESNLSKEAISFLKDFDSTINQNRDFIKEIFNDHSKISWTANGIVIDHYSDHD